MDQEQQKQLENDGAEVLRVNKIDRRCRSNLYYYDLQKLSFWSLPYNKILALDPDCIVNKKFEKWDLDELTALVGMKSPLCSAIMMLCPSEEKYKDMCKCIRNWSFDDINGWENCGGMPWDFIAAEGSQGFLFYYYGVLRRKFFTYSFNEIKHYGGADKNCPEYKQKLEFFLGHDVIWKRPKNEKNISDEPRKRKTIT